MNREYQPRDRDIKRDNRDPGMESTVSGVKGFAREAQCRSEHTEEEACELEDDSVENILSEGAEREKHAENKQGLGDNTPKTHQR